MTTTSHTIGELLRIGDPLRSGDALHPGDALGPDEALAMRRAAVAAAAESTTQPSLWHRPLALAALVLVMAGGLVASWRTPTPAAVPVPPDASADEPRQLQFATPGGTRIIWVFDQNLRLQESLP